MDYNVVREGRFLEIDSKKGVVVEGGIVLTLTKLEGVREGYYNTNNGGEEDIDEVAVYKDEEGNLFGYVGCLLDAEGKHIGTVEEIPCRKDWYYKCWVLEEDVVRLVAK